MNNNQTTQQTKPDPKGKAIASLALSVVSIVGSTIVFASYISFRFPPFWKNIIFQSYIMGWIVFIFFIFGWIFSVCGLTLGIMGLKSAKKNLAIVGTIFSLMSLGLYIYVFLLALRIGTA